jgi:hypothetical protein
MDLIKNYTPGKVGKYKRGKLGIICLFVCLFDGV